MEILIRYKQEVGKLHPPEDRFDQFNAVDSFASYRIENDYVVISSDNSDTFIPQLCNYMSSLFFSYSEIYKTAMLETPFVVDNKIGDSMRGYHKSFPILFRGGISFRDNEGHSEMLCMEAYVKGLGLSQCEKGPRLFCDGNFVDSLSEEGRKVIRRISNDLFEIVWMYFACEASDCCINDAMRNVEKRIDDLLLV